MSSIEMSNKPSIDYEEAMDMLLKSMEKSEVFQLRKHITKMVLGVGAVLLVFDIFIMGQLLTIVENMTSMKENVGVLQQLAVQDVQPPVVEPIPDEEVKPVVDVEDFKEDHDQMVTIAQEYYVAMNDLMDRQECTEEWYLEYKALVDEYADTVGSPDDLTQVFTQDELNLFYSCVETEVHGGSFASKVNVANVILNRLNNENRWENDLIGVITSPGQFTYHRTNVEDSTKLAVEYAYQFEDTTQGAEFFNSGEPNTNSSTYLFTDDAGHSFYSGTQTNYNKDENEIIPVNDADEDGVG